MRRTGSVLLLLAFASGCVSNTTIYTRPNGAKVTNSRTGAVRGTTPYHHSDTALIGNTEGFKLELEGYEDAHVTIERKRWNVGRTVIGLLFFLPLILWATDYEPTYEVELKPDGRKPAEPGMPQF
jgi:hypothetical protein